MNSLLQPLASLRITLVLLASLLAGCIDEPVPRLRIGTFQRPGFEPLFLAQSLGYISEESVQFVEFPSAAETVLAFRNHAIDGATVTSDEVLRLAGDGQPVRVMLLMNRSMGADAVLAMPSVSDVAALKGRKVVVESNSLGGYVLARALESAGLEFRDVKVVSSRVDRALLELTNGGAEAAVTFEPFRTRIARRGARPIFDSSRLEPKIADVLIVPAAMAEHPPAALREVTSGWFRALDYLATHADEAVARMAPREGLTPAQFRQALQFVEFADLSENHRQLSDPAAEFAVGLRDTMSFMLKAGMLPRTFDPTPLRSAAALPPLSR